MNTKRALRIKISKGLGTAIVQIAQVGVAAMLSFVLQHYGGVQLPVAFLGLSPAAASFFTVAAVIHGLIEGLSQVWPGIKPWLGNNA